MLYLFLIAAAFMQRAVTVITLVFHAIVTLLKYRDVCMMMQAVGITMLNIMFTAMVYSAAHHSLSCFINTKRSRDYILVKCWSGEQRDEYQSTSGSGNDGESDASDVNKGRTENLSNNNAVDACESFCSLPSDVSKTSVQEATSGVDVDLTEFDEPWPEQQQTDSCAEAVPVSTVLGRWISRDDLDLKDDSSTVVPDSECDSATLVPENVNDVANLKDFDDEHTDKEEDLSVIVPVDHIISWDDLDRDEKFVSTLEVISEEQEAVTSSPHGVSDKSADEQVEDSQFDETSNDDPKQTSDANLSAPSVAVTSQSSSITDSVVDTKLDHGFEQRATTPLFDLSEFDELWDAMHQGFPSVVADIDQSTFPPPPETFEDSFVETKSVDNFDEAAFDDQWAKTQQGFPSVFFSDDPFIFSNYDESGKDSTSQHRSGPTSIITSPRAPIATLSDCELSASSTIEQSVINIQSLRRLTIKQRIAVWHQRNMRSLRRFFTGCLQPTAIQ